LSPSTFEKISVKSLDKAALFFWRRARTSLLEPTTNEIASAAESTGGLPARSTRISAAPTKVKGRTRNS
jgi:hypothetical protein